MNRLVYSLLTATSSVIGNHAMDLFYLLKENFKKFHICLINRKKKLWECFLFIKLFVVTKMEISKNTLTHITSHWIWPCISKSIRVCTQYILRSGSLWHPLSSSMLTNKGIFLSLVSKPMTVFSLWLYNMM